MTFIRSDARWMLPALAMALVAGPALADSLVINNITYQDVRISAVRDGEIIFTVATSSNEIRKPIGSVSRINLSDEAAFSAAEEAYAAKDWDKATELYEKAFRTTQKAWLKDWVSLRLLESANKAGRFDAAITAYVALAEKSPETARGMKLNMPRPESTYLTDAIKRVSAAVAAARKDSTKQVLLSLLIELNKAKGDLKAANEALARSVALAAADPNSPEAARAAAILKLNAIKLALASKEYDKAIELVQKEGGAFTEPADVAEALFCLADAQAGKAAAAKDPAAWKEAALAYMRVVANCPPSNPLVPAALLRTAEIHETHLGERNSALLIYEQVAQEYRDQEPAKQAASQVARLKAQRQ